MRAAVLAVRRRTGLPYYATSRWTGHEVQHVLAVATGGAFDVEVTRVCEPVLGTIFRGSGIWGPIRLEPYCR